MNFAQLQAEVLNYGFDTDRYRSRVAAWVNEGASRVASQLDLPLTQATGSVTLVAGQQTYSLPTDFLRMRHVNDPGVRADLNPVDVDAIDTTTAATGVPTSYAIYGSSILVYPTPTATGALQLRYTALPADMAGDTDTPSGLPARYHDLLVRYAVARAFEAEDDIQTSQAHFAGFQRRLIECGVDLQYRQTDRRRQIPSMWA